MNEVLKQVNDLEELKKIFTDSSKNTPKEEKDLSMSMHGRFEDAPWMVNTKEEVSFDVFGVGNIGSWLALFLSRIDPKQITIWDDDIIESHNIGGQAFRLLSIGSNKISEVSHMCREMSGYRITRKCYRVNKNSTNMISSAINKSSKHVFMFSAFDNMQARSDLFNILKSATNKGAIPQQNVFFIDGRANVEHFQVFAINMHDETQVAKYEKEQLFSDDEVEEQACNYKSSTHCGVQVASTMCNVACNILSNIYSEIPIRQVPYYIDVNLSIFKYHVEF